MERRKCVQSYNVSFFLFWRRRPWFKLLLFAEICNSSLMTSLSCLSAVRPVFSCLKLLRASFKVLVQEYFLFLLLCIFTCPLKLQRQITYCLFYSSGYFADSEIHDALLCDKLETFLRLNTFCSFTLLILLTWKSDELFQHLFCM